MDLNKDPQRYYKPWPWSYQGMGINPHWSMQDHSLFFISCSIRCGNYRINCTHVYVEFPELSTSQTAQPLHYSVWNRPGLPLCKMHRYCFLFARCHFMFPWPLQSLYKSLHARLASLWTRFNLNLFQTLLSSESYTTAKLGKVHEISVCWKGSYKGAVVSLASICKAYDNGE